MDIPNSDRSCLPKYCKQCFEHELAELLKPQSSSNAEGVADGNANSGSGSGAILQSLAAVAEDFSVDARNVVCVQCSRPVTSENKSPVPECCFECWQKQEKLEEEILDAKPGVDEKSERTELQTPPKKTKLEEAAAKLFPQWQPRAAVPHADFLEALTEKSKAVSWCTVFQKAARILCGPPKADALSHWLEQSDLEKKRWGESFSAVRYALLDVSTPAADSKAGIAEEGKNDDILHVPTSYDLKLLLKDHGKQKTHASIATSLCCLVRFCFFKTTNPQGPKRVQETDFLSISMRPRLPTTREGGRCTAHWLP